MTLISSDNTVVVPLTRYDNEEAAKFWEQKIEERRVQGLVPKIVSFIYFKKLPRSFWDKVFLRQPKEVKKFCNEDDLRGISFTAKGVEKNGCIILASRYSFVVTEKDQNTFLLQNPVDHFGAKFHNLSFFFTERGMRPAIDVYPCAITSIVFG